MNEWNVPFSFNYPLWFKNYLKFWGGGISAIANPRRRWKLAVPTSPIILLIWQENCESRSQQTGFLCLPTSQPAESNKLKSSYFIPMSFLLCSLWMLVARLGRCTGMQNTFPMKDRNFDFSQCSTLYCLFNRIGKIFQTDWYNDCSLFSEGAEIFNDDILICRWSGDEVSDQIILRSDSVSTTLQWLDSPVLISLSSFVTLPLRQRMSQTFWTDNF